MKKIDFEQMIEMEKPICIPSIGIVDLRRFYRDNVSNQPLYNCEALEELISLILDNYAFNENGCELYLPVNKKTLPVEKILSYIDEGVIKLSTLDGQMEAGKRLAILAYLLRLQPNGETIKDLGLNANGRGIIIGDFLFPNGRTCYVLTFYHRDENGGGAWWFNCVENEKFYVEPSHFFAFSKVLNEFIS